MQTTCETPRCTVVTSNGVSLPVSPQYIAPLNPTTPDEFDDDLGRRRYAEDGYLWLRRALPPEVVQDVREAYFRLFDRDMFADGGRRRGAYSGRMPKGLPPHGMAGHPAHAFVRSERFRAFLDRPEFRRIAEALLAAPVQRIHRTPLRHFIRGSNAASRAHLDGTYLDYDSGSMATIWVPLGDCPMEAGGLVYLEGSHRDPGIETLVRDDAPTDRPTDRRPLTHDLKWLAETTGRRWLAADFEAGDVVVHSPTIVHASLDPMIDLMRLSTDIRFQRLDAPADPRWAVDWAADDGY